MADWSSDIEEVDRDEPHPGQALGAELRANLRRRWGERLTLLERSPRPDAQPLHGAHVDVRPDLDHPVIGGNRDSADCPRPHATKRHGRPHIEALDRLVEVRIEGDGVPVPGPRSQADREAQGRDQAQDDE